MDFLGLFVKYILLDLFQSAIIIFMLFAFLKKKVDGKEYPLFVIGIYLLYIILRLLPISFGFHTLIASVILIVVCIGFLKYNNKRTVLACLSFPIIIIMLEVVMVLIVGQKNLTYYITNNPVLFDFIGSLSNIPFFIIAYIIYYFNVIKANKKGLSNGENSIKNS